MNCRGCDQPILFGTYCPKCDDEVRALLADDPFEWPEWAKIAYNIFCFFLICLAVAAVVLFLALVTQDTKY